jgi:hypothetical protein
VTARRGGSVPAPNPKALQERLARIEALFNGGPDTPCRTTWRKGNPDGWGDVECVEVPMADLREAFGHDPR